MAAEEKTTVVEEKIELAAEDSQLEPKIPEVKTTFFHGGQSTRSASDEWYRAFTDPLEAWFVEPSQKFWLEWAMRNNQSVARSSNPLMIKLPTITTAMMPENWDEMQKKKYPLDYLLFIGP